MIIPPERSYEIVTKNYCCVRHKDRRECNQQLKLLFNKIIHTLSTCRKTNFTSHKQYFFGHLLSRNVKETVTDQNILKCF